MSPSLSSLPSPASVSVSCPASACGSVSVFQAFGAGRFASLAPVLAAARAAGFVVVPALAPFPGGAGVSLWVGSSPFALPSCRAARVSLPGWRWLLL